MPFPEDEDPINQPAPQDEPLPGELAQEINAAAQEHENVLEDLSQEDNAADVADEHDKMLSELSEAFQEPEQNAPTQQVADVPLNETVQPPEQQAEHEGRYYVPPKERTPANRGERRAEHDRILNEMRSSVERELDPPQRIDEFTEEFDDRRQEAFDGQAASAESNYKTGQSRNNQATLRMFETLSGRDMDIAHELEQMRMRLERDRL